jgi:CubicO group peptidase (beta-lactamase class C family)
MNNSSDPIDFVLSQKLVEKPGTVWNYSGGCTQMLAAIIKNATGEEADVYIEKNLFTPLGITAYKWVKTRSGYPSAASGLRLRSRDMAKIGLLMMNKGSWNGKRILPAKLVAEAMAEHISFEYPVGRKKGIVEGYGYQMWRPTFPIEGGRFTIVAFAGNGGQRVEIDSENKVMFVVTAGNYDKSVTRSSSQIYEDIVYPAILRKATRNNRTAATR